MSDGQLQNQTDTERVKRYPNGKIPASRRYIDYDGQVIIRTRFATVQRFKSAGWDTRRRGAGPYILSSHHCTEQDGEPMNDSLASNEFVVKYVGTGEELRYEVQES